VVVVTIEKHSGFGNQQKEVLGTMAIANDGSGTATVGHYTFSVVNRDGRRIINGTVRGFPRKQQGAWRLLKLALEQMYPSTQPGRRRRWPARRKPQQQLPQQREEK
jgi:hypothetical protein